MKKLLLGLLFVVSISSFAGDIHWVNIHGLEFCKIDSKDIAFYTDEKVSPSTLTVLQPSTGKLSKYQYADLFYGYRADHYEVISSQNGLHLPRFMITTWDVGGNFVGFFEKQGQLTLKYDLFYLQRSKLCK